MKILMATVFFALSSCNRGGMPALENQPPWSRKIGEDEWSVTYEVHELYSRVTDVRVVPKLRESVK